ncbi:MAG: hypothetical protein H0S79_05900 [Anaerolineaceae bacterium]|nr:hypothetical protein [Anaerolineaceae bacterium]
MKKILIIFVCSLFLVSCSSTPSDEAIQTAIANTSIAQISEMPSSTNTLEPTATDTITPTITLTPTRTPTPTNTSTSTPLPPATLTQQAIEATQTERSGNATATRVSLDNYRTATSSVITKTASANYATATEKASYEEIYWKELLNYPNNYIGEKVVVRGRIFNIKEHYIQLYFAGTYEAFIVVFEDSFSGIYDGDSITIYGVVYGEECGTNAYGGEICQPAILCSWFTKP